MLTVAEEDYTTNWFTLRKIVNQQNKKFSEKALGNLALQLLVTIEHIHNHSIVHGSINLDNVVYNSQKSMVQYKLVNFENARHLPTFTKLPRFSRKQENSPYISPELKAKDLDSFGVATDIWSLGMLIYTMLTGNFFNANESTNTS